MNIKNFVKKHFTHGGLAVLKIMVLLGVVLLLNLLASTARFRWDFSEGGVHTLDETTQRLLSQLAQPVRISMFVKEPDRRNEELFRRFESASGMVSFEVVDLTRHPERAEEYGIPLEEFVVVEGRGARRWVPRVNEQSLLASILQVSKGADRKVLFTQGHGETGIYGGEFDGLSRAKAMLEEGGYRVAEGPPTAEVLAEAAVVVMASPQSNPDEETRERLLGHVRGGGGLLVLLDPPPAADMNDLLKEFRIESHPDRIVEMNLRLRPQGFGDDTVFVLRYFSGHPIAERMTQRALIRGIRSLGLLAADEEGRHALPLCASSDNSGGRAEWPDGRVTWSDGPRLFMAATPEPPGLAGDGRVAVVGSSSFATNRYFDTTGNRELWELTVAWLAGDLDTPILAQKEPRKSFGFDGPQDPRLRAVFVVCVLVLPGISALCALGVFVKRAG